jgi:hypothetical protein
MIGSLVGQWIVQGSFYFLIYLSAPRLPCNII